MGVNRIIIFLAVIFPHNQMKILDYNRVLKDLNGMSVKDFISAIQTNFFIEKLTSEYDAETHLNLWNTDYTLKTTGTNLI